MDFSRCAEEWDYPPHTVEGAITRAKSVRGGLRERENGYGGIIVVTRRGSIAFHVKGD